jgi:hypothetical protein
MLKAPDGKHPVIGDSVHDYVQRALDTLDS